MTTYYKGKIGKGDIEFGTGTFNRYNKDKAAISVSQVNVSQIPRKITIKTANYAISANDWQGKANFNNAGATGAITFSLPPAISGLGEYIFTVIASQELIVDPSGNEYFRDCAAGKYKSSSVAGNILKIWCEENGIWEYSYSLVSGYWDDES